jgi:hypothetical protein
MTIIFACINATSFAKAQNTNGNRTTSTNERIIAYSVYDLNAFIKTDSQNYIYSNNNGSSFDFNLMSFNPYYLPIGFPMFDYINYPVIARKVLADSITIWSTDGISHAYSVSKNIYAKHDSLKNVGNILVEDVAENSIENVICNYYSVNKISFAIEVDKGLGLWDSVMKRTYSYDSNNRIVVDTTYTYQFGNWELINKYEYTYDGSSNLILANNYAWTSSGWILISRYTNAYYPDNKIKTTVFESGGGTGTVSFVQRDTFGYNVADYCTLREQYRWSGSTWEGTFSVTKNVSISGWPDTCIYYSWSSGNWVPENLCVYTYNPLGNPVYSYSYKYLGAAFLSTPFKKENFYYQNFSGAAQLKTVSLLPVKVFPNPAYEQITIMLPETSCKEIIVEIIGQLGQRLFYKKMNSNPLLRVDISQIPEGNYILLISSDEKCAQKIEVRR